MIVKIHASGTSFKGASAYLAHDPDRAKTSERVAWTHTLNCANDDVDCAVNEMVWTARDAEFLKQEAGIRGGGRATEKPAKQISMNWAPGDNPTQEHMIQSAKSFLRDMGWEEHQAILYAHDDKAYKHLHILLNTVHPETGLHLNEDYERRRAQAWALGYEREHGIHCDQRLLNPEEREKSMPRNIWEAFRDSEREFGNSEKLLRENTPIIVDEEKNRKNIEWKILKEMQRDERLAFFGEGKSEFKELRNSIYREVREEFREKWADYYSAKRNGADSEKLTTLKAELVAEQKGVLDQRRDAGCLELRKSRDTRYRGLLDEQREIRAGLSWAQDFELDTAKYLQEVGERRLGAKDVRTSFREASQEITAMPRGGPSDTQATPRAMAKNENEGANSKPGRNSDLRLKLGVGSFFGALLADLFNLGSAAPVPERDSDRQDEFDAAAEEALKQQERDRERERDDAEWRQRHRSAVHGE